MMDDSEPRMTRRNDKHPAARRWSRAALQQRTSQHQPIVSAGRDVRPPFRGSPGTQSWPTPAQLLFLDAIAMLLRVAQTIGRADLGRGSALAFPDKPTSNKATTARSWQAATSVASSLRRIRAVSCTQVPCPACVVKTQRGPRGCSWQRPILGSLHLWAVQVC
jgi:hypothetical protein